MTKSTAEHFKRADEFVAAAELLLANEMPAIALGRAYYAMFHAATAALLARGVERSSHHALIAAFGEFIVKPGLVDKRYHTFLRDAFRARIDGDYGACAATEKKRSSRSRVFVFRKVVQVHRMFPSKSSWKRRCRSWRNTVSLRETK